MEKSKNKYYKGVKIKLKKGKGRLEAIIEENYRKELNKNGKEIEILEYGVFMPFKGENIKIATIDEEGNLTPNMELLDDTKYSEKELNVLGEMLNILGSEKEQIDINEFRAQLEKMEAKTKEELEQEIEKEKEETSKDDNEENTKEDEEKTEEQDNEEQENIEKEEIAKKYNVNSKDVVHLDTTSEKITEDETFSDLVKWAKGRKNVYVVANKQGSIEKVLEKKDNEYEEINPDMQQMHGEYPNVDINLVGDDKITKIVPLKIYQIDSDHAFATIRNEWGELETIYCRKQEGEEKYWGSKVPERHGKNVRQNEYDARSLLSSKNTSKLDLDNKADELAKAEDLNNRGVPSREEGVQVEEIQGNSEQNYAIRKEDIEEDLYKRKGIAEKMKGAMPGYVDYMYKKIGEQADKILQLMQENKDMTYEEAVEQTEKEGQREEGGRMPEEKNPRW